MVNTAPKSLPKYLDTLQCKGLCMVINTIEVCWESTFLDCQDNGPDGRVSWLILCLDVVITSYQARGRTIQGRPLYNGYVTTLGSWRRSNIIHTELRGFFIMLNCQELSLSDSYCLWYLKVTNDKEIQFHVGKNSANSIGVWTHDPHSS